ncbi:MoxR family ATPase [Achromobacter insolitus]|uniref:AAA family ATPase n=1 Tax=Achromobacter insolitus TaxID=217204 RepID=UPI0007C6E791|nr:MoxR family ATPase [Achromobacter insolitus]AVG43502.1 MoxR family ATPase [Achromobacter insolitus]OAE50242.1 AAA family ATPase [Achromobacter insolitus]OCZ51273.1 AAA family ATPase [Achromobacter insolitus]WKK15092.1 MoxR family ATPase [Achromobacter insolitus]
MSNRDSILELERAIARSVLGQGAVIREVLLGLLADGHLLLESLPGLAKTRTVKTLAQHLAAAMSRIQFTPDLLPSDITGAEVLQQDAQGNSRIQFQQGPLFGNLILADEINRAPAKVQAALLEAMEERQITVAGTTHRMPQLFMVLATQNPIEQEGTYPLPEAQMDRFIMKIVLDYPDADSEKQMLALLRGEARQDAGEPGLRLTQEALFACRAEVDKVHVSEALDQYLVDLVNATRRPAEHDPDLARWVQVGASPRGAIALDKVARAHAWLSGQDFASPDDVRGVARPVLRHRLHLSYDAVADGITADQVIDKLLDTVAIPV